MARDSTGQRRKARTFSRLLAPGLLQVSRGAPRSPVPGGQTTGPARSSYFARRTPPAAGHVRPAASAPLDQCGCVCARGAGRCRTRVLRSAPHGELATSVPAHQSVRPRLMLRRQCRQLGGQMRAPQLARHLSSSHCIQRGIAPCPDLVPPTPTPTRPAEKLLETVH